MKNQFYNTCLKSFFAVLFFQTPIIEASQTTQIGQKANQLPVPNATQFANTEVLKACGLQLPVAADVSQAITHRLNIKTLEKKCSKTVQILNCISPQKLFAAEVFGEDLIGLLVKISYEECLPGLKNLSPDEGHAFICRYAETNIRSHDVDIIVACEVDPIILKNVKKARLAQEAAEAERRRNDEIKKRRLEDERMQTALEQERIENLNIEIQHEIYSNNQFMLDELDGIEKVFNQAVSIQKERDQCYAQKRLNNRWTLFTPDNICAKEIERSRLDWQHTSNYYQTQIVKDSNDLYDVAQDFELVSEYDQRIENYRTKVSEFVRKSVDTKHRLEKHSGGAMQVCRKELNSCKK